MGSQEGLHSFWPEPLTLRMELLWGGGGQEFKQKCLLDLQMEVLRGELSMQVSKGERAGLEV